MPDKLRILLVNRALPHHVAGGLERHVEDLAIGLAATGEEVHLLAAPLPAAEVERYRAHGVRVHAADCADPRRYTLAYVRGVGRAIEQVMARRAFDIIHAHEFALGLWRPPRGAPSLVLSVHGTITSETPLHPDVYGRLPAPARWRAWRRFGRRFLYVPAWHGALARADRILVDSAFTRMELARLMPRVLPKVRPVPLGVREPAPATDRAAARARLGWSGTQIVTIGRLEWQKGHALALHALARQVERSWHYTIVGEGRDRAAIVALVRRLGLHGRVTLAGRVTEEHKQAMLAAADLFLWPELTHPAFGLAGLEAMLAGTPVLATRRGAIPEVLASDGWLAEADAGAIAAALAPLLAEPERLAAARERLRERALARFPFDGMIESVRDVYRELRSAAE